jgi:hypothetical protein
VTLKPRRHLGRDLARVTAEAASNPFAFEYPRASRPAALVDIGEAVDGEGIAQRSLHDEGVVQVEEVECGARADVEVHGVAVVDQAADVPRPRVVAGAARF